MAALAVGLGVGAGAASPGEACGEQAAARLQALRQEGEQRYEAGDYEAALAFAAKMLRIEPGYPHALALEQRARRAQLAGGPASTAPRGRTPRAELLAEIDREMRIGRPALAVARRAGGGVGHAGRRPPEALARPVTIEFRDTPLPQAVERLGELGEVEIVLDAELDTVPRVSLGPARMPVGSAARWLARLSGLRCCTRRGAVVLTSRPLAAGEAVRRTYDVGSLALPRGDKAGEGVEPEALARGWREFIASTVAPGTWRQGRKGAVLQEQAPYTITYRGGRLVVVHTRDVHEQVAELLESFRRAMHLQVHITLRVLTLSKAYVETLELEHSLDSLDDRPLRRYRGSGSIVQGPGVGALSRFSGFTDTGGLDLRYTYLGDEAVESVLRAVRKQQKGTELKAQRLTCFNTQRAVLQVLTNHNYIRRVSTDNEPEIGNIPEGIVFDVQPFVSADRRYITLVLQPQMRDLRALDEFHFSTEPQTIDQGDVTVAVFQETYIQIPTTELRSAGTTVSVPNGGTLLVGGLAEVEETAGMSSVPLVGDLPVMKDLVRGWSRAEGRRSLVLLVTAEIVPDVFQE
ncbi:MAG: type II secretion system protein GspD [bacterium]